MAQQNGHRRMTGQQKDLQRVFDLLFFTQHGNMLREREQEQYFYKLAGLKGAPGKADPRLGVHAAAALDADAEE